MLGLKRQNGTAYRHRVRINLMDLISGPLDQTSSPQVKIALFRSLFRGRDDVYPRRFESRKTGRSGYAPACANEWVRGLCEKPRIKCAECPNRRFLPVTDDVIRWHLSGSDPEGRPFVAGVYPLLRDETCFFLAVDFDKAGWRDDAAAFLELVATSVSQPRSSGHAPGEARMSGFSSKKPFRPRLPDDWDRMSSPRQWRDARTSGSIPTTGSFRIKTRCRKEDSET
jgi:hypothetical protein